MNNNDKKRKTLLLVNPANRGGSGFVVNRDTRYQPLSLGILAAMTPPDWKIKIIDENFRKFHFYEADLVGLTAFSSTASRAYEIADFYREKGIPVVMGGIHVSMFTEEALQHASTVVIGEAENVWNKVLRDFENGYLEKTYQGTFSPVLHQPMPPRHLFHPAYVFASVQTSRGCPMDCSFCSVSTFNGRHYRYRPLDEVMDEMESIPQRNVFILDDNIVGYGKAGQDRAIALFNKMIERNIKKDWIGQASLNFADNDEVLRLAAKSGCKMIFIGIETEQVDQLMESNKRLNLKMGVDSYKKVFRKIHKYGISVIAGFMFGWDSDTEETIRRRVEYIRHCNADSIQSTILTPLPGTRLYKKMEEENRLILNNYPEDWKYYGYEDVVYRPILMEPEQFKNIMLKSWNRIYHPIHLRMKFYRTLIATRSLSAAYWSYMSNWNYRNMVIDDKHKKKNRLL